MLLLSISLIFYGGFMKRFVFISTFLCCFCFLFINKSFAYNIGSDKKIIFSNGAIIEGVELSQGEMALLVRNKSDHNTQMLAIMNNNQFISYHNENDSLYVTRLNGEYYSNGSANYFRRSALGWGFSTVSGSGSLAWSMGTYEVVGYSGNFINRFDTYSLNGTYYYRDTGIPYYSINNKLENTNQINLSNGYTIKGVPNVDFFIVNTSSEYRFIYPWQPDYLLVEDENGVLNWAYYINGSYWVGCNCRLDLNLNIKTFTTADYPDNIKFDTTIQYTSDKLTWYSTDIVDVSSTNETMTYNNITLRKVITGDVIVGPNITTNNSINYESDDLFTNIKNFFLHLFWPTKEELSQLRSLIENNNLLSNFRNIFFGILEVPTTTHFVMQFNGVFGLGNVDITGPFFDFLGPEVISYIKDFVSFCLILTTSVSIIKIIGLFTGMSLRDDIISDRKGE